MNQGILAALRGDQDHRVGSFDILDTSPKATLDSQAEWSGGLIGSSTSRGGKSLKMDVAN